MPKKIAVITSGGDVPGLNACLRAIVHTATHEHCEVLGVEHGYDGLIAGEFSVLTLASVRDIVRRGGTVLRSARSNAFMTPAGRAQAAANLKAQNISHMVVVGGDGSLRGAAIFGREHDLTIVGVPKTIDNDVSHTDTCIGYDTATNTAMDAIDRIRDTADSHERIYVIEVMGRDSGYIAFAAGLAGAADGILIPETTTDWASLTRVLKERHRGHKGSLLVVVAEGDESGGAINVTQHLAAEFPDEKIGICVLGHIQRGGAPTAADRLLAARFGVAAVMRLRETIDSAMVGLQGNALAFTPLGDIQRKHLELNAERKQLLQMLL
ncbi:MAG: ATP-dependent 6-phosphofructokinase [Spirochaetes bacterium]|nr:ATP-dependent 6-phosphofructokinase [Spirochaetota bacterium]